MYPDESAVFSHQDTTSALPYRWTTPPRRGVSGVRPGASIRVNSVPHFQQRRREAKESAETEFGWSRLPIRPRPRPPQEDEPLTKLEAKSHRNHLGQNAEWRPRPSNRRCRAGDPRPVRDDWIRSMSQKYAPDLSLEGTNAVPEDYLHPIIVHNGSGDHFARPAPAPDCRFPLDRRQARPIIVMERVRRPATTTLQVGLLVGEPATPGRVKLGFMAQLPPRPRGRIYEAARMHHAPARFKAHAGEYLRGLPPQVWLNTDAVQATPPTSLALLLKVAFACCAGFEDGRRPRAHRLGASHDFRSRRARRAGARAAHGHVQPVDCASAARALPSMRMGGDAKGRSASPV